MIHWL